MINGYNQFILLLGSLTFLIPFLLQGNTLESKAHCMQYELSHSDLNIEAWLLARHSMAGAGRKTYYLSHIILS